VAVGRPIGGHTHTPGGVWARSINSPTVPWGANRDFLPQFLVLGFVFNVKVVDIKATNIGLNFVDAVVTPIIYVVPDGMAMRTNKTVVIPMVTQGSVVKLINFWHEAKINSFKQFLFGPMEVSHC
jgi:hypothetical protein